MTADASDAELLQSYAREGAEDAFAELVRRYLPLVYHAAARQLGGDVRAAEDVSLQAFTLLARKAASLTGHVSLAGWLHTTTRLIARETLRATRRRLIREQEAYLMQELSRHSPGGPEWEQLRPVIDEAVAELNGRDREAVLLRFFAGLPLAQVGARINLSENAARMRVDRALEKLRSRLARRGVTSTASALAILLENQAATAAPVGFASVIASKAITSAAAAGGAGGFSAVFGFMSIHQLNGTAIVACALVVALGTATHEIFARRDEQDALAQAIREQVPWSPTIAWEALMEQRTSRRRWAKKASRNMWSSPACRRLANWR